MSKQRTHELGSLAEQRYSLDYVSVITQCALGLSLPISDLYDKLKTKMRKQAQRGPLVACLQNENIEIYNQDSDEPLCKLPCTFNRGVMSFRNTNQLVVLYKNSLKMYDIESQERLDIIELEKEGFFVGMIPVGEYVVFHSTSTLCVYDPVTGKVDQNLVESREILDVAALDDKTVATCSENAKLQLWDVSNGIKHVRDIAISSRGLFSLDKLDENTLIYTTPGYVTSVNVCTGLETNIIVDVQIKRGIYMEVVDRTKLAVLENQSGLYVCRLYDLVTKQSQVICTPESTTYRPFGAFGSILVYYEKAGLNFFDVRSMSVVKYTKGDFKYNSADLAVI